MKRAMFIGGVVVSTLAGALILWELRQVVLLFMLALAVAAAGRPIIDALVRRGVSRVSALLAVYLVTVAVVGITTYFLGVELGGELQKAGDQALGAYERLRSRLVIEGGLRERLGGLLPNLDALSGGVAATSDVASNAASWTYSFVEILARIVLVLVLALYWDAYRQESLSFWMGLLRPEWRRRVRALWVRTLANVGEQLRNEVGQSLVTLGACALIFRGLGMSYWLLPSVAAALMRLFPFVGVLFATLGAALAGWVDGPFWGLAAAAVVPCVHFLLEHVVARRVLRRKPSNPVVLIFAAMILVSAYGIAGLVLAPLVTAALQPALESMLALRSPRPLPMRDLDAVTTRLEALRTRVEGTAAESPEVQSLIGRLESLVTQATGG